MVTAEQLLTLPGAHLNGRPNCVTFTCPLCKDTRAYALTEPGKAPKYNCPGCFQSTRIAEALVLPPPPVAAKPPPPSRDLMGRVPPQNVEAEQSVLGAILLANESIEEAQRIVKESDFYREPHRVLYRTMLRLWQDHVPIDAITLDAALRGTKSAYTNDLLQYIGGSAYVAELAALVPTAAHIAHYAGIVRDMAAKRELASRAMKVAALAYDGVSVDALVGEADRLITPLLSDAPAVPDFKLPEVFVRNQIEVLNWEQMRTRRSEVVQRAVVDKWLFRGETSLWSGKVEHGKTTLMRELAMCVLRGEPFLGHDTVQGRVFYAMLDADGETLTYDEFAKMGFTDEDAKNMEFLFEPTIAAMKFGPEQLFAHLWQTRPDLVIIDPFARLKQVADFHDYTNTYLMAMLSAYAKQIDAHLALPGHIPRGRAPDAAVATAAFGSVAFGAGVNARFVCEFKEDTGVYLLRTSKGKSAGFESLDGAYKLERNVITGRIELGKPYSFGDAAAALKPAVLDFLNGNPGEEFSAYKLVASMDNRPLPGAVRAAANMLAEEGLITRTGKGKRGSPYMYERKAGAAADEGEKVGHQRRFL